MKILSERVRHRALKASNKLAARFHRDEDGATAVEFAIVALPFFILLFGIIELAVVFFISSMLTHATSEAGRTLRTGNFQACGGKDEFKALVCNGIDGLSNCWDRLRIDVIEGPSFKTIAIPPAPEPPKPDPSNGNAVPPVTNGTYDPNIAGSQLVVRSTYYYQLVLPPALTRLENPVGSGSRILTATTAFRNEPFPASGTCDAKTQQRITDGTP